MTDGKSEDKWRGEDKWAKGPKKQKNGPIENKGPLPKYTNYHSFTAPLYNIYVVMDRGLYRSPKPMKSDRI